MNFDQGKIPMVGKAWPIPKLVDWNRDGFMDVLVFHRTIDRKDVVSISYGGAKVDRSKGEWKFEALNLTLPESDRAEPRVLDVGDYDGDGKFDLVTAIRNKTLGKPAFSTVLLMKNVTENGLPKFEEPRELYRSPEG